MTIKLNGSSSGSVSLDAPADTTGGLNPTFYLPVADGTNGQFLKTDGSGQLAFGTVSIPEDQGKVLGTATGRFIETQRTITSTSWVDTGIEVTYTPVASNSTALIHFQTTALLNSGNYMYLAIRQDDAILGGGSSDTEFMGPTMGNSYAWTNLSFSAHITPTWTAGTATTFNIYCARHSSGSTLYMGWGDMGSFGESADWITIQEIKA
tara:strand:- start:965 stop:1588 length:624 start_codon:yes stop_codon:yes gene_type:complete